MITIKQVLVSVLTGSFVLLTACYKDCKPVNQVVTKTGIVVSGDQQVPPLKVPATGTMDVSYNKGTHVLTFMVAWNSLSGTPTGAHIHGTAPRGVNAPIVYNFFSIFPKTVSGTFTNSVMIDTVNIKQDSLLAGFYYLNIHTPTHPGGEIRGQIEF